ncbi:hypothetical protein [Chitinophaga vietnamensis]|uniref:hypothetical protein n=1 Tax=Chitinophaga vietnamensis TaxID=2593957 RepID=UPI001177BC34|nr:hypothetical protein [Chitinophaga vietnamensis]
MSFLKTKTTWSNAEFIPFKLCIASLYIIVGAYFHEFFSRYYIPLAILFVIATVWTIYLWAKKPKVSQPE